MFLRLLLLFTLVPLLELFVLIVLGRHVGLLPTIALVLTTGVLGAWLAKTQGLGTWQRLRTDLAQGRMPADALFDGLLILIAGAVLLTPGLFTDLFGFALLTPAIRKRIRPRLARRFRPQTQRRDGNVIIIQPE